jgi:hypothetical protein
MKKSVVVILSLLCIAGMVFAADKAASTSMQPYVDKGNILANVGIGWGGLGGGAEYEIVRFDIANVVPVVVGAGVRVALDPGILSTYSSFTFGGGALATCHVELTGLNVPDWVKKLDLSFGLGLGVATGTPSGYYSGYTAKPGIGLASFEGLTYFFSKNLGVILENGYVGAAQYSYDHLGYSSSYSLPVSYDTIGVVYKF